MRPHPCPQYYEVNAEAVRKKAAAKYAKTTAFEHAGEAKARAAKRRFGPHVPALRKPTIMPRTGMLSGSVAPWSAANRERKKAANLAWNKANPEQARRHQRSHDGKRRRERDPVYAMAEKGSDQQSPKPHQTDTPNGTASDDIIGRTFADFAVHIERRFPRGMSWQNRSEWHIDQSSQRVR